MDYFKNLKANHGLSLTWCAKRLGYSGQAFKYACQRGLTEKECEILEEALHDTGRKLLHAKIPQYLRSGQGAAMRRCPTDAELDAHAQAGGLLDQEGKWRLVADPFGGEYPWPQFQLSSGEWVWPDCVYTCSKCDACLGCERKFIRKQAEDGTWYLDASPDLPLVGCDDGGEHECAGEDEEDE